MRKKIFAVGVGFSGAVLILLCIECFFRANEKHHWFAKAPATPFTATHFDRTRSLELYEQFKDQPAFQSRYPLTEAQADRLAQTEPEDVSMNKLVTCCIMRPQFCKSCHSELVARFTQANQDVYRVPFTTDAQGRRITPVSANPVYNILMFGDSFTLGEGVRDEESSPYQLAILRPDAQVYNLGLSGGSPSELLYELTHPQVSRITDVSPRKTVVLFTFFDQHMERISCRSNCLNPDWNWLPRLPFYQRSGDQLIFRGTFEKDRRYINFIYSLIARSAFLNFFNFSWPLRFTTTDFDFLADLVAASRDEARKLFPDSEFYFVIFPNRSLVYGERAADACRRKGIAVLDFPLVDMEIATGGHTSVPGDGHPSPQAQLIFAHLLDQQLPKATSAR